MTNQPDNKRKAIGSQFQIRVDLQNFTGDDATLLKLQDERRSLDR
jgi:hypothetical protein